MTSKVTYAVELYFDKKLEEQIMNLRQKLAIFMDGPESQKLRRKYLTMATNELSSRPCITLLTTTNYTSSPNNYALLLTLIDTLNSFFSDIKAIHLSVALDLEDLVDLGDVDYMYLAPMDRNHDVRGFKKMLCEEMKSKGIDLDRGGCGCGGEVWRPVVPVVKQTWEQFNSRRAQDESIWVDFCKENKVGLYGGCVDVGVVQVSPRRVLWKTYDLIGRDVEKEQVYGVDLCKSLELHKGDDKKEEVERCSFETLPYTRLVFGKRCYKVFNNPARAHERIWVETD